MNYWTNQRNSFYPAGGFQKDHGQPLMDNNVKKVKTKAYLNPQIVNYEFIKRSLTKNDFPIKNKIHINPNFRGHGVSNVSDKSLSVLKSPDNLQSKPESSNNSSTVEKKSNLSSPNNDKTKNNYKAQHTYGSKSQHLTNCNKYSWSKNSQKFDKTSFNFNQYSHSYLSPKKSLNSNSKDSVVFKSKLKIIKSKTKLVNKSFNKTQYKSKIVPNSNKVANISKSEYAIKRKSAVLKVAKAVQNKYKFLKNSEYKKSKYKIDKRNTSETSKKKINTNQVKDIRKLFPNYVLNKLKPSYRIYDVNNCNTLSKTSWKKNQQCKKVTKKNKFPNKQVVKIGGIFYKSTTNKLILADKPEKTSSKKVAGNLTKGKSKHVVYVRGEKFILEKNGKALRRQCEKPYSDKTFLLTPKRIDIGGVTYLRKSQNVLIRTNVHHARQLVNKAKNRSIAVLVNLRKKSSKQCMIYHKFGKCNRHTKGLCMYQHDSKNIAMCKKFLQGNCDDNKCLLSHEMRQEKMATCYFFLKGLCFRENCPYLHVKLNKNADICKNFLQGFCSLGKECSKRHLLQCPHFDKYGTCNLGSKCSYPHKKSNLSIENMDFENPDIQKSSTELQYYTHSKIENKPKKTKRSNTKVKENAKKVLKNVSKPKHLSLENTERDTDTIKCFPKRIKLDNLPCFIPLSNS